MRNVPIVDPLARIVERIADGLFDGQEPIGLGRLVMAKREGRMFTFIDRENGHEASADRLDRTRHDGVAFVMRFWLCVHGMLPGQETTVARNHVPATSGKKYIFLHSLTRC